MVISAPRRAPMQGPRTLRISQIVSALKNRDYDQQELGDFDGIRQGGAFNEPLGNPGATSVTFRHDGDDGNSRAIRIPHGVVPGVSFWTRLERLSEIVGRHNSAGGSLPIVDFEVHRNAIWPESEKIDVITMPWVEGRTIHSCARNLADEADSGSLSALSDSLEEFGKQFQASAFDHGDISGGNIMVSSQGSLQLIDPDTLRHEDIGDHSISEMGHPSYAHSNRSGTSWEDDLFRFPLGVIIVGTKALALDPSLVERFGDDDGSLLFESADLSDPTNSELFDELCKSTDDSLRNDASRLRKAAAAGSVAEANRILGSFRCPKPLPISNRTVRVSPLRSYVAPRSRREQRPRTSVMPLAIPSFMRNGGGRE